MVFSSSVFLFLFLPLVLLCLAITPGLRGKNLVLLVASLIFYAYGEGIYLLLMLAVTALNWLVGLAIERGATAVARKRILVAIVVVNLLTLAFFKYFGFLGETLNSVVKAAGGDPVQFWRVHLPLGISFYVFHMISYVVDVYSGRVRAEPSLAAFTLYTVLFPQLVAGPIVRYQQVAHRLSFRIVTSKAFADGVERFIIGLSKKVLIANQVAVPADKIFALPPDQLTSPIAWFGIFCYTLQIYFDCSGYSDMAVGIGRMFGFRFPENFSHPYISQSIQEFWRRWHMTLSKWFRDYLYVPLGGNRVSAFRTQLNLLTVFLLCGLWHGASWNFVIWGAYHGLFLSLERTGFGTMIQAMPRVLRHAYTLLVVLIGWVFFRADDLPSGLAYLRAMFWLGEATDPARLLSAFATNDVVFFALCGVVAATPLLRTLLRQFHLAVGDMAARSVGGLTGVSSRAVAIALGLSYSLIPLMALGLAVSYLIIGSYNPFIYFRF